MCAMFPLAMQHDDHVFTWLLACPEAGALFEAAVWANLEEDIAALLAALI